YYKALRYAKDALSLFPESASQREDSLFNEWFEITEVLADCHSMCQNMKEAIVIYESLSEHVHGNKYWYASICTKISRNYLWLFDYFNSIAWGSKGLEILGRKYQKHGGKAILRIFVVLLKMVIRLIWFKIYKHSDLEEVEKEKSILLDIQMDLLVPGFFFRPFSVIDNGIESYCDMLYYKDFSAKFIAKTYWGVLFAVYGFDRLAEWFYEKAQRYFEVNFDPSQLYFIYYTRGYLLYYSRGDIDRSEEYILKAFKLCKEMGDSFWTYLCYQSLCQMSYHGGKKDYPSIYEGEFEELWKSAGLDYGFLMSLLKHKLMKKKFGELDFIIKEIIREVEESASKDFLTIDTIYRAIASAEVYMHLGRTSEAIPLLRIALRGYLRYFHRVCFCGYVKHLLVSAYVRTDKKFFAFLSMLLLWFDPFDSFLIYRPQRYYASAEFFYKIGFKKTGKWCIRRGIHQAMKNGWDIVAADGYLLFSILAGNEDPFVMEGFARKAKAYFEKRGWKFMEEQCDKIIFGLLMRQKQIYEKADILFEENTSSGVDRIRKGIETRALANMFMRFNVLSDITQLYATIIDTLCSVTGADRVIVYLKENESLKVVDTYRVSMDLAAEMRFENLGINRKFLSTALLAVPEHPVIQRPEEREHGKTTDKSAMIVPLRHNHICRGLIYLGSSSINDLFDKRSFELLEQISSQIVITLLSFELVKEKEEKASLDSNMESARAFQQTLLPFTVMPGEIEMASYYKPSERVGGDWIGSYYDEVGKVAFFYIGDVTGHGITSAFVTAMISGVLYGNPFVTDMPGSELVCPDKKKIDTPRRLTLAARTIDRLIGQTSGKSGYSMSMILLGIDVIEGKIHWISAGHPPLVLSRTGRAAMKTNLGSLLGVCSDPVFPVKSFDLEKGDTILLYTDGLFENRSSTDSQLKIKELKKILSRPESPRELIGSLVQRGRKIWGEGRQEDDVSIMVIRWKGEADTAGLADRKVS
ncbi:MAG: SpoIIE family protein phosphatase, partial [Oligoflexales bacterium]|nr:SpoIIE family protein phosphatase [Oligoflexales bacterium]